MIKKYRIAFFGIVFFMNVTAYSQEKQAITLADVLKIGGASNLTIKEYNELQKLALAEDQQTKSWWLPEIYAGAKTHNLWGIAMNTDGRFFNDLARENFWGGLGLNIVWNFGDNIYQSKASGLRLQASEHLTQAKKNETLLVSIKTYYNCLQAQLEMIAYQELVKQSKTIVDQLEIKVDAGLVYQSDLLSAKANHSYLQTQQIEAMIVSETNLLLLAEQLNIPSTTELVCADTILTTINLSSTEATMETVWSNRPEIKYLELKTRSLYMEKKTYTTGLLIPELRAGTDAGVFGQPISPLANQSVLNVSLMWRFPLGELFTGGMSKTYQSKIMLSEIKLEQTKSKINQEVSSSQKEMQHYGEILELSKKAQGYSKEALSQSIQRQQLETAKVLEVFQMQQAYLKARLGYTKSVINYNVAQYKHFVALGNKL